MFRCKFLREDGLLRASEAATASESLSTAETGLVAREEAAARLAELHAAHGRSVLAVCRTLLRDPTEAEDASQGTFLAAFRSLLKGTVPREPGAWLAAIARNECWARVRARMREPLASTEPEEAEGGADPLAAAIGNEDVTAFWTAFSELPRPQQEAFLLREFRGLSYAELALALGASDAAVESLLFRARRGLRAALASVAAFPFGLRDLLERLGPGAVTTGVGVKAATATVGIGLVAVTAAGLQAPHHATQVAAVPTARAVAHHPALRPVVRGRSTAAAAPAVWHAGAARPRPRFVPVARHPLPIAVSVEVSDLESPRVAPPQVEPSAEQPQLGPESVSDEPTREEASVTETETETETEPSGESGGDDGH